MKKPLSIVSGEGLGISNSTYRIFGKSLLETDEPGHAQVKYFTNIATGNLVIQTPLISVDELGGPLHFQWTANSQASPDKRWQLNWHKQLINPTTNSDTLEFLEEDGHLTAYKKDATRDDLYFANQVGEGNCYFNYSISENVWIKTDPKTAVKEFYDITGRLVKHITSSGHTTTFDYDTQGRLVTINAPSGVIYKLNWLADGMELSSVDKQAEKPLTIIRRYYIDHLGRLFKESYPTTDYAILYNYTDKNTDIDSVTQTDQTKISFEYLHDPNSSLTKTYRIMSGIDHRQTFDYSAFPIVKIADTDNVNVEFNIDETNLLVTSKNLPTGYEGQPNQDPFDKTSYEYEEGLIKQITFPDNTLIQFEYDHVVKLKTLQLGPGLQKQTWKYDEVSGIQFLVAKADYPDINNTTTAVISRYVYDVNFNNDYVFLRFTISPVGAVTEYIPDSKGRVIAKRDYLANFFDLSHYPVGSRISYDEIVRWAKQQPLSQTSLTTYEHNDYGQVLTERSYTDVDDTGVGIDNDSAAQINREWTILGDCTFYSELQQANIHSDTHHEFDDLKRKINQVDALERREKWEYQDNAQQLIHTLPNSRTEQFTWDTEGNVLSQQDAVKLITEQQTQTRTTRFRRDGNGLPVLILLPTLETQEEKLLREHQFFDKQQRSGFKISRRGQVTETRYNAIYRTQLHITYADPIDITNIYDVWPPEKNATPSVSRLMNLLPKELGVRERVTLQTFTPAGKINFYVNEENYITEYRYDNLNRLQCSIRYENKITETEFQRLLQNESLMRTPNPRTDAIERIFYYADGKIQATQNPAGYVTEYFYDAGRRTNKNIIYYTQAPMDLSVEDFNPLRPNTHPKDATTYRWYDNKNNEIANVDGENYLTVKTYYPTGKIKQAKRFNNRVVVNGNTIPTAVPSSEDQVTTYFYDKAQRLVQVERPHGATEKITYDMNDNIISSQTFDRHFPNKVTPNFQRNTQTQYDGWNQPIAIATVFVGQRLAEIDADATITPEQKQKLKAEVWDQWAEKQVYDETGLLLYRKDSQGGITYFYYDSAQRPILQIDPTGIVIQTKLDNFDQPLKQTTFYNRVSSEQLHTLTGGYVSSTLMTYLDSIRDPAKDRTVVKDFNKLNTLTKIINPENDVHTLEHNFLNQCIVEHSTIDATNTLTISHELDNRGLEVKTTASNGAQSVTTQKEYHHPAGLETAVINELGGRTEKDYDGLNRLTTQTNALNHIDFERTLDAFNRIQTEKDAEGAQTTHEYIQETHQHITHFPAPDYSVTETLDIFSQTTQLSDAKQNTTTISHSPAGHITQQIDPQKNTYTTNFNRVGLVDSIIHPNQSIDKYQHNLSHQQTALNVDSNHLNLQTTFVPNAFGDNEMIVDPRGIKTQNTFDKRGLTLETIVDVGDSSEHLNLIQRQSYNGIGNVLTLDQGDSAHPSLYQETYQHDLLGRKTGQTIDPAHLNLQTNNLLNDAGFVTTEMDTNGNKTLFFYNLLKQKRFKVDPAGAVTEWQYNALNKIHCERELTHAIDMSQVDETTKLADIEKMVARDINDGQKWTFYDAAQREQFQINGAGQVIETVYDNISNPIQTIIYANGINRTALPTYKTADILAWTNHQKNHEKNRTTYRIFAAKEERYVINAAGYITEYQYDHGKKWQKIRYSTKLNNPEHIANLPVEQIDNTIAKDPDNDRVRYELRDSLGRPWFIIKKISTTVASVLRYQHDGNGNLVEIVKFAEPVNGPFTLSELLKTCTSLQANSAVDQIISQDFDNANRKIKRINPLGFYQQFVLDALNNQIAFIDEANNQYDYPHDTAKRLTGEILPPFDIAMVQNNGQSHDALSLAAPISPRISNKKILDNVGNILTSTRAEETIEKREIEYGYDHRSLRVSATVKNVNVDDESQAANFSTRPEKTVTLTQLFHYDARKNKISEKDFDDRWTFYIYDSENREIFKILPNKSVVGTTYNIFGEVATITQYDNVLSLDLSSYEKIGISLATLQAALKSSQEDRIYSYDYNNMGKVIAITHPAIPYFLADESQSGTYGFSHPIERFDYNAFNEKILAAKLINPELDIWQKNIYWYNLAGKKAASCDPNGGITRKFYDTFRQCILRHEWGTQLKITLDQSTPLSTIDKAYTANPKDRSYVYTYNLLGKKTSSTIKDFIYYTIGTNPFSRTQVTGDATKQFFYNALGLLSAKLNEKSLMEFFYYNNVKKLIAKTGIMRVTSYATFYPLTYYYHNSHGEEVASRQFALGTSEPSFTIFPQPISYNNNHGYDDNNDHVTIKLINNVGLEIIKQGEELAIQHQTYTPTKKLAREYHRLTHYRLSANIEHLDEKRVIYNAMNFPLQTTYLRDDGNIRSDHSKYNTFNEVIAEGENGIDYVSYSRSANGKAWKHNSDRGAWTIELTQLHNTLPTLKAQSPSENLSTILLDDLPNVLDFTQYNHDRLHRNEFQYDLNDQLHLQLGPTLTEISGPHNIPLNIYVGHQYDRDFGKFNINWLIPKEKNVDVSFVIYPRENPSLKQTLPIIYTETRAGVNVSALPSDIYAYDISYHLNTGDHPEIYHSQGEVQFESSTQEASTSVVPIVENDNQLRLVGKVAGLTAIKVKQNLDVVSTVPVTYDSEKSSYTADFSHLPSGRYTISPVSPNLVDPKDSLEFLIYTPIQQNIPLSKKIDANIKFKWLGSHAQLEAEMTPEYAQYPLEVQGVGVGDDDQIYDFHAVVLPEHYSDNYIDDKGNVLNCNIELNFNLRTIYSLSVSLCLDEEAKITLLSHQLPLTPDNNIDIEKFVALSREVSKSMANDKLAAQDALTKIKNHLQQEVANQEWNLLTDSSVIQTADFGTYHIVTITPLENPYQYKHMLFKDMSNDALAQWKLIIATPFESSNNNIPAGIAIDVSGLPYGHYPYRLGMNGQVNFFQNSTGEHEGIFTIVDNGAIYSSLPVERKMDAIRPIQTYEYDRWSNKIFHQSSLGDITTFEYNARDKLSIIHEPKVLVMHADGSNTTESLAHEINYDNTDQQVATFDGNKHTTLSVRNTAGQLVSINYDDGSREFYDDFDIFGNVLRHYDDRFLLYCRSFNRCNQMTSERFPSQRLFTYSFDELNHRVIETLPNTRSAFYNFNSFDDLSDSFDYFNRHTQYTYHRTHQWLQMIQADGQLLNWTYDYFGKKNSHIDFSGTNTTYIYNYSAMLTQEAEDRSAHGFGCNLLEYHFNSRDDASRYEFSVQPYLLPPKNLVYTYCGNHLLSVTDNALGQITTFDLDREGRRSAVTLSRSDGTQLSRTKTIYDGLGRDQITYSNEYNVTTYYDGNNNRRFMHVGNHESWFDYDSRDRVTAFDGILLNGHITLGLGQGSIFKYTGNLRTWMNNSSFYGPTQICQINEQNIGWDVDGRLTSVQTTSSIPGNQPVLANSIFYTWDPQIDVIRQYAIQFQDFISAIPFQDFIMPWPGLKKTITQLPQINDNFWQTSDYQRIWMEQHAADMEVYTNYNVDPSTGINWGQLVNTVDSSNNKTSDELRCDYIKFDSYQLGMIRGQRTYNGEKGHYADSNIYYTSNGYPQATVTQGDLPQLSYMVQTYDGNPLSATSITNTVLSGHSSNSNWTIRTADVLQTAYIYNVNDQPIASYDYHGRNNAVEFKILPNYMNPISPNTSCTMQRHMVQVGDTFKQIAQRMYGDEGFAKMLALRCGYASESMDPSPGTLLNLPNLLPIHNRFNNYTPYNTFMNVLYENFGPSLKMPATKTSHHTLVKTFIEAAAAMAVFTGVGIVAYAALEGFALSATTATLLVSAVQGAASAAVSQGVAIALHDQTKFQWQGVFEGAVEAVLAQGTAALEGIDLLSKEKTMSTFLQFALVYGETNAEVQLLEIGGGLRQKFDFNEVLEHAVSNAARQMMASKIGKTDGDKFVDRLMKNVALNLTSGITDGASQTILRGQMADVGTIEAQALGNAISSAAMDPQMDEAQKTYSKAQARAEEVKPVSPANQPQYTEAPIPFQAAKGSSAANNKNPKPIPKDKANAYKNDTHTNNLTLFGNRGGSKTTPNQTTFANTRAQAVAASGSRNYLEDNYLGDTGKYLWPSNSTSTTQINNALNTNQQTGFVNGMKDALRDDYNMLKWATTHLSDVGRALVTNFENNLGSYLDRNLFENKLQKDHDLAAQSATNLLHDIENGNYYSAGRASEALAIGLLPVGKLGALAKGSLFALGKTGASASFLKSAGMIAATVQKINLGERLTSDSVILYRSVNHEELKQLLEKNEFLSGPNSLEGKFFAEHYDHAMKWGDIMNGPGKHTVIEVHVPNSIAEKMMRWPKLDGIGAARYGTLDQLRSVKIYLPEPDEDINFKIR